MNENLVKIGFGLAALNLIGNCVHAGEKPNILWIVADDLGTDLKCYGNKSVYTPNTDKLASEGIVFTQVFSVTPVCSPSRSCLITGMYPVSVDCHQHRTHEKKPLPGEVLPITEYFRKAGYYVCNGSANRRDVPGKTDYNFDYKGEKIFDGTDWSGRNAEQPFFAQIQIHYPHRPFEKDKDHPVDRGALDLPPVYPDHPLTREDWALYLESVQHVDQLVGEIMERLDKEGLLKNTIVMFFGDQGRPMVRAKQFLYDEGTHTPLIVRFPDKLNGGKKVNNLISNVDIPATSLVLAGIDLPAYMQGRNFLSNEKREYVFTTRDRMDETVDRIRSVRSSGFKYIRNYYPEKAYTQFNTYKVTSYPVLTLMKVMYKKGELTPQQASFMKSSRPKEELYDLNKDPYEMNNLAENKSYSSELIKLRKVLDEWVKENDKGTYPENSAETDYWAKNALQAYRQTMKKFNLDTNISDEEFLRWWENRLLGKSKE